jgi:hypothetical protein
MYAHLPCHTQEQQLDAGKSSRGYWHQLGSQRLGINLAGIKSN